MPRLVFASITPPESTSAITSLTKKDRANVVERLNKANDRAERHIALTEPMVRTMEALLPQLEALVATGNDVYKTVLSIPGVSALERLATRADAPIRKRSSKTRSAQQDS